MTDTYRRKVAHSWEGNIRSLLAPWRTCQVWNLHLECGHKAWRYVSRFPNPPRRVKCHKCERLADV